MRRILLFALLSMVAGAVWSANPGDTLSLRIDHAISTGKLPQVEKTEQVRLTLPAAQRLALQANSQALGVVLDQEVNDLQLRVGENDLRPKFSLAGQGTRTLPSGSSPENRASSISLSGVYKMPTSTQLEMSLSQAQASSGVAGSSKSLTTILQIVQPLLKNAGPEQATIIRENARLAYAVSKLQNTQTLDALYIAVTLAYQDALQARQQDEVAQVARDRVAQSLETNRQLHAMGRLARLDLLQFEADLAQADLNLAQARNAASAATTQLLQWLGPDMASRAASSVQLEALDERAMPSDLAKALDEQATFEQALSKRADWQVARVAVETSRLGVSQATNERLPQVDLVAAAQTVSGSGIGYRDTASKTDYSIGVRISVPLDQAPLRLQVAQAKVSNRKAELAVADLRNQILNEVRNSLREEQYALRQLELAEANLKLNRDKLDAEHARFQAGRSSALQLSTAQEALKNAEVARVQAFYAVRRAYLERLRSTGNLAQQRQALMKVGNP